MKNIKQDNREIKCVADNFVLLSNPPKYKCINCGQIWFCHDNTPTCNIPMKTKSNMTVKKPKKSDLFEGPNSSLAHAFSEAVERGKPKELVTDEQKWINYIKEYCFGGDIEIGHSEADKALRLFLISLGYSKIVNIYDKVEKWYA